jgi:inner membrane protein involved in colicin E2 resistance
MARPGIPETGGPVTVARLFAIAFIFLACTLAWFGLGTSVAVRSGEHDGRLAREVAQLWGGPHTQTAPHAWVEASRVVTETVADKDGAGRVLAERRVSRTVTDKVLVPLESTRVEADLQLEHRQRGLLWYDTYTVAFRGEYRFRNPRSEPAEVVVGFAFPSETSLYDDFVLRLNGQPVRAASDLAKGLKARAPVAALGEAVVEVGYRSRGLDRWTYAFDSEQVTEVRDAVVTVTTNVARVDFPVGTMSPVEKTPEGAGWRLTWRFANLVTGQRIGVDLPNRLNPGPLASRVTFFAPVSLLFFLTVMVMLGVTRGDNLHPMNYFFLSAAFFAFHLLLAYLVDVVSIHVAFAVAAPVSLLLVGTYLRKVAVARATRPALAAQAVFLVAFAYAFFLEGLTGLTVAIGAVITLFVLMQMTARVAWAEVFTTRAMSREAAR